MKTDNLVRHLSLRTKYSVSYEWHAQVPIALPIGTNFLTEQNPKIERISDLVLVIKKLTKTTEDATFRRMTEVAGIGVDFTLCDLGGLCLDGLTFVEGFVCIFHLFMSQPWPSSFTGDCAVWQARYQLQEIRAEKQ